MNENEYKSICNACDQVLLSSEAKLETIAIPWLHIIREHPVFINNYTKLLQPKKKRFSLISQISYIRKSLSNSIKHFINVILSKQRFSCSFISNDKPIDVLFISHLLNASQANQEIDFYFGDCANKVLAHGKLVTIAFINHTSSKNTIINNEKSVGLIPRIIFSNSLCIKDEFNLWLRLIKESLRLKRCSKFEKSNLVKMVYRRAADEALSHGSFGALRMSIQISELVNKIKPKTIIVTYEGHAWERIVFSSARSANPNIQCIAYQHAMLFPLQHAIQRNLSSSYNPNHILTSGLHAKKRLKVAECLDGIPISVLGKNRITKQGASCKDKLNVKGNNSSPTILVLPEGIPCECHILFDFALAFSNSHPKVNFIWRLHPVINYDDLTKENRKLSRLPDNVVLSDMSLNEDISSSDFALYRGSTSIIDAARSGLIPIYLKSDESMTIDPLEGLCNNEHKIKNIIDLENLMLLYEELASDEKDKYIKEIIEYCEDIFVPLDCNELIKILV